MGLHHRFWGKAKPATTQGPDWHPLVCHSLDVAAVGKVLLARDVRLQQRLSALTGVAFEELEPWIVLLLAMHDVGKFSLAFQSQVPALVDRMLGVKASGESRFRHDRLGHSLFFEQLLEPWAEITRGCTVEGRRARGLPFLAGWVQAVTGHHGKPTESLGKEDLDLAFGRVGVEAALAYVKEVRAVFPVRPIHFPSRDGVKRASWLIAGLAVLADWLGSYQGVFAYRGFAPGEGLPFSLSAYFHDEALAKAREVIAFAGVEGSAVERHVSPFASLFPHIAAPSPLQALCSTLELDRGAQMFVIEDATGAGKTEAALVLAQRLMAEGHADGFYVAMPTMATANGMYPRIEDVVPRMFAQAPAIALAHGSAKLARMLRDAAALGRVADAGSRDEVSDGARGEAMTASQHATSWLEDGNKKALLAQAGVGTIDQALLAVLPARHAALRQLGLHRKVLVVDEVHACDAYMLEVLSSLIAFQVALGGSVILLSATLAQAQRDRLLEAFSKEQSSVRPERYPSLIHVGTSGARAVSFDATERSRRETQVRFVDDAWLTNELLGAAAAGGCAAWVKNTVADAIETFERLRAKAPEGVTVLLFHARFALGHRLETEDEVLRRFGKASSGLERRGVILVATQVIEQSLDLDFDALGSDLAPVDLLVQRAGRLRRHVRDASGARDERPGAVDARGRPELWVNAPGWTDEPTASWLREAGMRGTEAVYPRTHELWHTMRILRERGAIRFPDEAHVLIESVYGELCETPEGLRAVKEREEGKLRADGSLGAFLGMKVDGGYELAISQGAWQPDTRVRTRLGDEAATVRLGVLDGGELRPLVQAEGLPRQAQWSLSELSVRVQLIDAEHPDDAHLVEAAKKRMSDAGRFALVLVLHAAGEGRWQGRAVNQAGREVVVLYDRLLGLQIVEQKGA